MNNLIKNWIEENDIHTVNTDGDFLVSMEDLEQLVDDIVKTIK